MTTLIETWSVRAEGRGDYGDDVRECISELTDACTPRPPQSEWFGTGEGQWDAWWIQTSSGAETVLYGVAVDGSYLDGSTSAGDDDREHLGVVVCVLPVAREGFPAPVGWQVIEHL